MTDTAAHLTLQFLRQVFAGARITGARGRADFFADRLVQAGSQPSLADAMQALLRAVDAELDAIHPPLAARMVALSGAPDGARVLQWWRESPKLVALLAATRDEKLVDETLAGLDLPRPLGQGAARPRGRFDVGITARCLAPLAHGADGKAGNATLFRRQQVLVEGGVVTLPYVSGNALRGQMRDLLADHFLHAIGIEVSRAQPAVALWFFYALYLGGALEEKSAATKAIVREMGDAGAVRASGVRAFRELLPGLSLLGCALGNRVLPGRCQVADLRPRCAEWGTGDRPVAELMGWEYLTRREDHEEHVEHHGMIATVEVLRAGVELEGGIDVDTACAGLERAALGRGLALLAAHGYLGAENRRGLGRVEIALEGAPDPAPYDAHLAERRAEIVAYLREVGALAPQGAATCTPSS